jgi:hypothetical protein
MYIIIPLAALGPYSAEWISHYNLSTTAIEGTCIRSTDCFSEPGDVLKETYAFWRKSVYPYPVIHVTKISTEKQRLCRCWTLAFDTQIKLIFFSRINNIETIFNFYQ